MKEAARIVLIVTSVLLTGNLLLGCGSSQSSSPPSQSRVINTTTQNVSAAEGGRLALPTGETLVIPPGALSKDTTITMQTLTPAASLASTLQGTVVIVELLPDGLTFLPSKPAKLTLLAPAGGDATALIQTIKEGNLSSVSEGSEGIAQSFDEAAGTITAYIQHFSEYTTTSTQSPTGLSTIQKTISAWWKKTVGASGIFDSPYDLSNCINCRPRTVPVSKIIIHSTNDAPGTTFTGLLSYLTSLVGTSSEAPFATYYIDDNGHIARLVPDEIQTSHIAGHNTGTIGIELFDPNELTKNEWDPTIPPVRKPPYSKEQITAVKSLISLLKTKFNLANNSVCTHRHFTQSPLDPLHQDPYHISDADFDSLILKPLGLVACEEQPPPQCIDAFPNITASIIDGSSNQQVAPSISLSSSNTASVSAQGTKGNVSISVNGLASTWPDALIDYKETIMVTSPGKSGQGSATITPQVSATVSVTCADGDVNFNGANVSAVAGDPFPYAGKGQKNSCEFGPDANYANSIPASSTFNFTYGSPLTFKVEVGGGTFSQFPKPGTTASVSASLTGYGIQVLNDPDAQVTFCRATQ